MVSKGEGRHAIDSICNMLKNSGFYEIDEISLNNKKTNYQSAIVKELFGEKPRIVQLLIANAFSSAKKFNRKCNQNYDAGIFTAPILYMDEKSAFASVDHTKLSLSGHSEEDIKSIIETREIERGLMTRLGSQDIYKPSRKCANLQYFLAGVGEAEDSIVTHELRMPVSLRYTNLEQGQKGKAFVLPIELSKTYAFTRQVEFNGVSSISEIATLEFNNQRKTAYFRPVVQEQLSLF